MNTMNWHLFAIDKPTKSGDYMTVCDLGRLKDEGKPYGLITVNPYHVEGEKIPYTSPSITPTCPRQNCG